MKHIIYIGDFNLPYSTEVYITAAFRELGHMVTCVQESSLIVTTPNYIVDSIKSRDADIVLFSKGRPRGEAERFIELLKKEGIKTVCWLFDLYFGLPSNRVNKLRQKQAPYNSEIILSTDGGHDNAFAEIGITHKLLRQGVHKPEAKMVRGRKNIPVLFVGGDYFGNRKPMLDALKKWYGKDFVWRGDHRDQVRGMELNKLFANSKVVVGHSQPSPHYWSNRIYETLGRGGFLLHPYIEGLEKEFVIGKHLACYEYDNLKDLHEKIDYYLTHDKEREEIRKAGFEYVKNNHTYTDRCREFFKLI